MPLCRFSHAACLEIKLLMKDCAIAWISLSAASAMNNNTTATTKVLQSQKSTFSKTGARSHASLATPAGRLVQRGPPPRFRPWMIILVTMFIGMLFIGIVLTVVAHWPGYTSIGADPLEIVGPVLLAVGELFCAYFIQKKTIV